MVSRTRMVRRDSAVSIKARGHGGLVRVGAHGLHGPGGLRTMIVQGWRETSIGNPSRHAKQPYQQHSGCPAAKLKAVEKHGVGSSSF